VRSQSPLHFILPKGAVVRPLLQVCDRVLVRDGAVCAPSHQSAVERPENLFIRDSRIIERRGRKEVVILSGMLFGRNGGDRRPRPVGQVLGTALELQRQQPTAKDGLAFRPIGLQHHFLRGKRIRFLVQNRHNVLGRTVAEHLS